MKEDTGIVKPEDLEVPDQKVKVEDKTPTEKEPELSPIEKQALEMGWRPKDEFDGEDDDFIDAKEFVRRKPLFDKIESTSKELKAVRRALESFKQHYSMVKETEYNRAMEALKKQRKLALEDGDGDRFEAIDTEIKNVEKQVADIQKEKAAPVVQDEPEFSNEFLVWKDRNKWYDQKAHMRVYADQLGVDLHKRGMSPQEVLRQVEKEVKRYFQQEFTNPRKSDAPNVESSRANGKATSKRDDYPLTAEQKKAMHDFARMGLLTPEEYIQSLREADKNLE